MNIVTLVNNTSEGILSVRARYLMKRLNNVVYFYRSKGKFADFFSFLNAIIRNRPKVVYVVDTVYPGLWVALFLKPVFRYKLIVDTGDIVHRIAEQFGRSKFMVYIIKVFEELAYKFSEAVIVRGTFHKKMLEERGFRNVHLINDGVDINFSKPFHSKIKKEFGNNLVIGIVGSIHWNNKYNSCYGSEIVEVLKILKDKPVKGLIVGDGTAMDKLKKMAVDYGVSDRIVMPGRVAYKDIPDYVNAMDICLLIQPDDPANWVRTTGKLPEYLAMNKFVIASTVGEASLLLNKVGVLLKPGEDTPEKIAEVIKKVLKDRKLLKRASNAREIALERFNYDILSEKMSYTVNKITGG